ncbi:4-hydroxy-2-oxoheptanedioate aldolase [Rhodoblastus acidophilus]|uniref:4-hydroxy-2-oxoheptanedioate aldolase n=1 Tax=Candidatus Rhodoblastus alkanivorans TaxID=2954117 RepID=A0ABS9Z6X1_9HYPH|nr:4-hydroxy-2-oxoheptanedioate aldolase [Candidatus Rhodoblastus alkanivorans]MCI4680367.1 4-hydroxy-2-oxoheptanedioate aldolase [Candidatus Rhodoblastus alkanivorans]MCI4682387.1 4-hydroxy-2-oxoheptanedioate aldolase [Candidatus Rhodoblastus alkanivorans]MDI4639692.1 4-hydroxy-2-oxoheptanedioate aldolase [Rhodoblastus acidophilus]
MTEEILANPFKSALQKGATQIGLWLAMADPYSAEICAGSGFDWLLLDGEHSPLDLRTMLAQLQSLAPYPTHAVVRPPTGDPVLIKQMLDIGAQSLLIPMVETPKQAEMLVRATRYPPRGFRGVGAGIARAARWGRLEHYLDRANDEVCLLLQVETRTGLENLEAIAAIEGVDGVFLGAADLSASLGHIGQPQHPEVVAAMEKAIRTILAHGKAPGLLATDEAVAAAYLKQGARFVAVGVDALLLVKATQDLARRFKGGPATGGASPY